MAGSRYPGTLGERLRWAIDRAPSRGRERGLRLFQRRIDERSTEIEGGISGTSLSMIQSYLRDDHQPSLVFTRVAAELLGVREEWLAFGSGLPTQEEQQATDSYPGRGVRGGMLRSLLSSALDHGIPAWRTLPHPTRGHIMASFNLYRALPSSHQDDSDESGPMDPERLDRLFDLARLYGEYLMTPFEFLEWDVESRPVESTLIIEAILRPIEIVAWTERIGGDDGT